MNIQEGFLVLVLAAVMLVGVALAKQDNCYGLWPSSNCEERP